MEPAWKLPILSNNSKPETICLHQFQKLNDHSIFCVCGEVRSATLHSKHLEDGYESSLGRMRVIELDNGKEPDKEPVKLEWVAIKEEFRVVLKNGMMRVFDTYAEARTYWDSLARRERANLYMVADIFEQH